MSDPWAFTCLLPVWAEDDPAQFRQALASVATGPLTPTRLLICQDGDLPPALATVVTEGVDQFGAEVCRNLGPKGLHHNLNNAAGHVDTPWIARADADDVNLPGRFAAQFSYLQAHPDVSIISGAIEEFWPDGRTRLRSLPTDHEAIIRWARYRSPINHMTALFRTDLFRACGGYPDVPQKEDYALWIKMIAREARFANLPQILARARLGSDFYSRRAGIRNLASEWAIFRLKRRTPQLAGWATAAWISRSLALSARWPAQVIYEALLRR